MGDDEGGPALHHLIERRQQFGFGLCIKRAGRLIEDQDRCVLEQSARNCQTLSFTAGRGARARRPAVELVAAPFDELNRLRAPGSEAQLVVGRVRLSNAEILGDGTVEQEAVLKHDTDVSPKRGNTRD